MSQMTPEERALFTAASSKLPRLIRAYLWTLQPALTTRGRLVVGFGMAAIVGCIMASVVEALINLFS